MMNCNYSTTTTITKNKFKLLKKYITVSLIIIGILLGRRASLVIIIIKIKWFLGEREDDCAWWNDDALKNQKIRVVLVVVYI